MFYKCLSFLSALVGLCCGAGFSLVVSGGYSLVAVCKRRLVEAFLAVCRAWPLEQGLRSRGGCTWLLRRIGDLPRPGTEPVSPALADGFFNTGPPGKPYYGFINSTIWNLTSCFLILISIGLPNQLKFSNFYIQR